LPVLALALLATAGAHGQASDHFGSQVVVVPASATQEYTSIAIDSAGNLYIGDQEGHKVYKETLSNGTYTQTVAVDLSGEPGFGPLEGVAVDNKGNLYIADTADETVYMETPAGGGTYTQTVVAQDSGGDFINPLALAVDSKGNVFCTAQTYDNTIQQYVNVMYEFTPAGGGTYTKTQVFTSLIDPDGLAVDSSDNLYIDDGGVPAVYKETLSGGTYTQSTVVDDSVFNWLDQPGLIAVDNLGDVFVANGGPFGYNALTVVEAVPAAGGTYNKRNFGGGFGYGGENQWDPYGIAADNNGNVFITAYVQNSGDFEVQELSSPPTDFGQVNVGSTSAAMTMSFVFSAYQSGGVSSSASGGGAGGEFVDLGTGTCATNGTSFLYEPGDSCTVNVTFTPKYAGQRRGVVTLVNSVHAAFAQEYLTGTGVAPQVSLYPGTVSTIGTGLTSPQGVAVDGQGIVYILDTGNLSNFITETPSGGGYTQGMVNYSGNDPVTSAAGLAVDGSDCLYANYDEQGAYYTGQFRPNTTTYTCEGIVADVESGSTLKNAQAVAVDGNGNVYIADTGDNRVIEEFYSSGSTFNQPANWVTVVADTGLSAPAGVAADSKGNVYIADTGNNRVLKETPAGGGTFTQSVVVDSGLSGPTGLAVDAIDNLYISDTGNKRVLKETISGSTVTQSVVLSTGLGSPQGLALDGAGNLYIADMTNQDVVKLTLATGPTLTFDSTAGGTTSSDSPQTVTVSNVGTAALTFPVPSTGNNPSISANFSLSSTGTTACPLTTSSATSAGSLAANASCTLPISFTPSSSASGAITGSLILTDNTLNVASSTQTVTLNGTATQAGAPVASLSPTTLAFGNETVGSTSAAMMTTLSNTGNATLDISGITLNDTTDYSETTTCGSTLTAGSTCTISVTFHPGGGSTFDATLSVADNAAGSPQTVALSGTGTTPPVITETGNLWFNPAPVAISAASAQTLTATFTITGESSLITPTAVMHYGLAYAVGKVTCTGSAGNQTCSVPVTFIPNYPGGRKDALFLMNGTTRLATELAFGVGQSPLAAIQPGVVTNAIPNNNAYVYDSVVDENGTVYAYLNSTIYSVTAAGVVTELTVPGLSGNSNLSIDGAGVIYFGAPNGNANAYVTYDTVQGTVGSLPTPVPAGYYDGIASGNEGNIYEVDNDTSTLYTIKPDGTTTTFALNPTYGNPYSIVVDTNENLFATNGGNGSTEEITPADVETQVNTTGGNLGIDAANTVYVERFYGLGTSGVGELPASGYANALAVIDSGTSPTGNGSVAPDGTVYVGNYDNLDKVDRSQGTISFGEQNSNVAATPQAVQIYNGGNENLTLSNISITGEGFTIGTSATDNCSTTTGVASGALCNLTVDFLPTHAGVYSGTVTLTSNSLNNTSTTQTVALSGFVYGVYVTAAPNPLAFGSIEDGNTSPPQTVTFTNNGDLYSAGIGGFSSTDPAFVVTPSNGCSSVGVGASCTATVTFAPTAVQAYSATISFSAGSSGGGPNQSGSFTVTGTGTAAAAPVASLSPTTVNFGGVVLGATAPVQNVVLSNTGTATLTGIAVSIGGTNASDFAINTAATTCGSTLAASSTCNIGVTFTPASAASFTAKLSVADDATGSPQTTTLNGTGVSFVSNVGTALAAQPVSVNFATGGKLSSIQVLTLGAPNLDFTVASGGSCATGTTYTAGDFCTVNVAFKPAYAGTRGGAILLTDSSGVILATAYLPGEGAGAQIVYGSYFGNSASPSQNVTQISNTPNSTGVAVDSASNLYVAQSTGTTSSPQGDVIKVPWNGTNYGTPVTIVSGAFAPAAVALDGAGNVYYADSTNARIQEVPWTGSAWGTPVTVPFTGLSNPSAVAVDDQGNVYAADYTTGNVLKLPWAQGSYGTQILLGTVTQPVALAVDGAGLGSNGYNVYVMGYNSPGGTEEIFVHSQTGGYNGEVFGPGANFVGTLGLAVDGDGDVYYTGDDKLNEWQVAAGGGGFVSGPILLQSPLGGVSTQQASSIAVDGTGNIYFGVGAADVYKLNVSAPPSLSFASTTVDSVSTDSPQLVQVLNIGNQPLTFSPTPAYPSDFPENSSDSSLCSSTSQLAEGTSCDVSVNFKPTATGSLSEDVVLTDNNLNGSGVTQSITVSGTGTAAPAPAASLSPTSLSFASTAVGSTSAALSTTLSNTGNAVLNISGITLSDTTDFAKTTTCGSTLAAGANCTISVTFSPAAAQAYNATLSVADNAAGSPQTASLSGTGTPAPAPGASLSPATLAFPSTNVGASSAAMSTTLSNTGNAVLNISGITLSDTTDFSETTTCGSTLAAGATCTIAVTFKPGSVGSLSGTLSVADNAAGSPQTVALSGTGLTPPATDFTLAVAPPAQTVQGGSVATYTVTLNGIGGDFANAVELTVTGLPAGATASFNPSSVTPGANGASSTLSIQTQSQLALAEPRPMHKGPSPWLAALLVVPLLGLRRRLRNLRVMSCMLVLAATLLPTALLSGCGGGYFAITTQTYTVTVTGTSGSIQHTTTVTLTVQQQ
jgi:sugar lactone lactonase YvrE